jgi:hypothetical protein
VSGNNVSAYGLAVEHYQQYEVIWNGQNGKVVFFQNENPYDPPSQAAWEVSSSQLGYPAFYVANNVTTFNGYGMGSYCYFNQGPAAPAGWITTFSDNFAGSAGSAPNAANWFYDEGTGFGTGEIETMTNSTSNCSLDGSGTSWTSCRLESTRDDFFAPPGGQMEMEASIEQPNPPSSDGLGYWPAFWSLGSRFTSGAAQTSGMTYEVNMGSARTVDEIDMSVPDYPGDYARGYSVEVSPDGTSWTTVASCAGTRDPEIVSFPAHTDQYLQVVLTTGVSPNWWSIEEFLIY